MDFEDIKRVNEALKKTDIKGKDYVEVHERVKAFRMLIPDGTIETEVIHNENGICSIKAIIRDAQGKILATGHAQEKENSSFINKTSYVENCETSAVGRALGMLGIGIDADVASANEVINSTVQLDLMKFAEDCIEKIAPVKVKALKASLMANGISESKVLEHFEIQSLEEMTEAQFSETNLMIETLKEQRKKGK